ncbi:MAG: UDP-2,3-diacylglucosamine diphosphatase LpxI [Hyphomicrobiales bacterium]|nr:UDP-2,3-diacylglucosamine diphosphatase LpxI [Hyphomicrobiales bacterium]
MLQRNQISGDTTQPLGVIAGGGALPLAVVEAAAKSGRSLHVLAFRGNSDAGLRAFPHTMMRWGEIGKIFQTLHRTGCKDVVLVGSLKRPQLMDIRPDGGFFYNLPSIFKLMQGGDDSVLSRVVRLFESKGFRVVGAHDIAPHLVAPRGPLGQLQPSAKDLTDIALGLKVVRALGALDVGQAAAVSRGYVLAVEAAEGTDEMLRRCARLHQWGLKSASGVLVKCSKPGQELRVDMPAIGPNTVELAAAAGLRGIAVAAGRVLVANPQLMLETAESLGLFVVGVDEHDDTPFEKISNEA